MAEMAPIQVRRSPAFSSAQSTAHTASPVASQALFRQLDQAIASKGSLPDLLKALSDIVCENSDCLALWISQANRDPENPAGTPPFVDFHPLTDENANALWETVSELATTLVAQVQSTREIVSASLPVPSTTHLVTAPIVAEAKNDAPIEFILLGCFSDDQHSLLRLQWLMGIVVQSIDRWLQSQVLHNSETRIRGLSESLKMISELDATTSETQTAMVVVNHLRRLCAVDQVAMTIDGRLVAISDVEQFDGHNESNKIVQFACNQAAELRQAISLADDSESNTPARLALENYCRAHRVETCLNLPLLNAAQEPVGGLLFSGTAERLNQPKFNEYTQQLVGSVAGHLSVVLRSNRGFTEIAKSKVKSISQHSWRKPALIALLAVTLLMSVPLPYRVACDCELQPVLRRYVSAPYEGVLDRSLVKNGEIVTQNQLLAQLDGRNLRIELAGLEAELAGAQKRRDLALATGDIAQSQIARSEMDRYQAKADLLQQRTFNLEVRSPIDGIIVSGDLEKVEGAPLEMGQTLFEVAPLDEMVSEVAIPESEIQFVKPGMEVAIKLSAFPFKTWTGTIESIHPRAELLNDESVFIAQVSLANENVELRPGMKGTAKVRSTWSPLAWNLFHRPWEAVRYWTIW